jgi:cytochrome oxidase Cu insertion factor (SCO1/SenC/PrrC family)
MRLGLVAVATTLLLIGVVALALLLRPSGGAASANDEFRGTVEPAGLTMPAFALRDQVGRLVTQQKLRGKVVVLTFLDTKCVASCPIIAGEIAATWKLLTASERSKAVAVGISVNPLDDTPANVRTFLVRHRASRSIRYLVGPMPAMRRVWRRFFVLSAAASGNASTHSAPVRVYSRNLSWLATQHVGVDLSPQNLAHDIRVALRSHDP